MTGIFVALTTPFDHAGRLYRTKVQHNVSKLNEVALAGYLVCGSTGEAPLLGFEERAELLALVRESAAEDRQLIAGVGSESVVESVRLSEMAARLGYGAALAFPPFYYRDLGATDADTLLYFRALADRSPIPVLLYNIPQVTGAPLSPDIVRQLSIHPNITGMKDSSGNLDGLAAFRSVVDPKFPILSGSGHNFQAAIESGAQGAILAIANALPYTCVTVWEAMRMRQHDAAADWQQRIHPLHEATRKHGLAGLKYAMDLNGFYGGPPRLPYSPVSPAGKAEIEAAQSTLVDRAPAPASIA